MGLTRFLKEPSVSQRCALFRGEKARLLYWVPKGSVIQRPSLRCGNPFNRGGKQKNTQIQLLHLRGEGPERVFDGKGGPITCPGGTPLPTWTLQDRKTQKAVNTWDLGKWQV